MFVCVCRGGRGAVQSTSGLVLTEEKQQLEVSLCFLRCYRCFTASCSVAASLGPLGLRSPSKRIKGTVLTTADLPECVCKRDR